MIRSHPLFRLTILVPIFLIGISTLFGQFRTSIVLGYDFFQRYRNPVSSGPSDEGRSSGAVLAAIPLGIEFSVGAPDLSFGIEATCNFSPVALDLHKYKGLGALSFPIIARLNFGAMTGMSRDKMLGFSLGGGLQYNRTELFGLKKSQSLVTRDFFPTYVGELILGGGIGGFTAGLYLRIGGADGSSFSINTGLITRTSMFKKNKPKERPQFQS